MQLFVCEACRRFLGELLDAFLPTTTLQAFKKLAQAARVPGRQDEVVANDLLQQFAFRAA